MGMLFKRVFVEVVVEGDRHVGNSSTDRALEAALKEKNYFIYTTV